MPRNLKRKPQKAAVGKAQEEQNQQKPTGEPNPSGSGFDRTSEIPINDETLYVKSVKADGESGIEVAFLDGGATHALRHN